MDHKQNKSTEHLDGSSCQEHMGKEPTHEPACQCGHGHECAHDHEEGDLKHKLTNIIITVVLLAGAYVAEKTCDLTTWQLLLAYLPAYLLIGHDTLTEAWEGICNGDFYNEDFLMSVATIGALLIGFLPGGEPEFPEAVFVMLFFQIGEMFEGYAEGKSRDSIAHLMDIRPDTATVERDGKEQTVAPEDVAKGEVIVVSPGEKIAVDGRIVEGSSTLDTSALTGESMPREVEQGDDVLSGCINLSGVIRIQTTKTCGESTVSKILSLVEQAHEKKSESESFITKFARIYTPIVVWTAILLAFVPPVFTPGLYGDNLAMWLHRALIFLIVSCPCALVVSVPLTFFAGIGGASRHGILIKGSNYMDALSRTDTVVFDKTGTLTQGTFSVKSVHPAPSFHADQLIRWAALAEKYSTHPIGEALRTAYTTLCSDDTSVDGVREMAGRGICAHIDNTVLYVGNLKMMQEQGIDVHEENTQGTRVHIATEKGYAGCIVIADSLKKDSRQAVSDLKHAGVRLTVMLTGDAENVAEHVAAALGLDRFKANLLPADKVREVEGLINGCAKKGTLAFVGDGINDAPVLKRADVGIAMGGMGSDAAIDAADVVLMDDQPSKIAKAIAIARKTIGIARQNITFAIGVKIAILILATFGLGSMGLAVFADVGVTVLAVFNAMRALR